jgi:hypothetical protein
MGIDGRSGMKVILLILLFLPGLTAKAQELSREEWEQQQKDKSELLFNDDYKEELHFQGYYLNPKYPIPDSARDARIEDMLREHWIKTASPDEIILMEGKRNDSNGWRFDSEEWDLLRRGRLSAPKYYRDSKYGSNGGVEIG